MKNIAVLRILVIIYFTGNIFSVYGQESAGADYSLTVAPQIGFIYGQTLELVYSDGITKGEFLSELRWDMKPVFYAGFQFDIGKTDITSSPGFYSMLSFKMGIPCDSGFMEDRDWMDTSYSHLTHFSKHTNKTHELYLLDISLGASIPVKSYFYIIPFISGSWMRFSFSGRDGYGKYARCGAHGTKNCSICPQYSSYLPIDDDPYIHPYSGKVITYSQDWFLAALGFTIGAKIPPHFNINLTFKISPLTYCIGADAHLTTNYLYDDYSGFGLYIEPGLCIAYTLKKIDFSLDFNYRHISKTRGILVVNNSYISNNDSGAGLSLFDLRFLLKFHL